jgi:hypothetical protein
MCQSWFFGFTAEVNRMEWLGFQPELLLTTSAVAVIVISVLEPLLDLAELQFILLCVPCLSTFALRRESDLPSPCYRG